MTNGRASVRGADCRQRANLIRVLRVSRDAFRPAARGAIVNCRVSSFVGRLRTAVGDGMTPPALTPLPGKLNILSAGRLTKPPGTMDCEAVIRFRWAAALALSSCALCQLTNCYVNSTKRS